MTDDRDLDDDFDFEEGSAYEQAGFDYDTNSITDDVMLSSARPPSSQNMEGDLMTSQDNFNILSGINEIPPRFKEQAPELLTTLITYNNIPGEYGKAEWQIKSRTNIRKRQMDKLNSAAPAMTGVDIAVITYYNDLLLTRAENGFERKMTISSMSGVLSEADVESAPRINGGSPQQKRGFLSSIFGGK